METWGSECSPERGSVPWPSGRLGLPGENSVDTSMACTLWGSELAGTLQGPSHPLMGVVRPFRKDRGSCLLRAKG